MGRRRREQWKTDNGIERWAAVAFVLTAPLGCRSSDPGSTPAAGTEGWETSGSSSGAEDGSDDDFEDDSEDEQPVPPEPTSCRPQRPAPDTPEAWEGWHLLVDDHETADHSGLRWVLGPITKHGVVLETERPNEFHPTQIHDDGSRVSKLASYLTVLWNDDRGVFQMWYEAYWEAGTAYAESSDGIAWTRVDLADAGDNIVKPNAAGMSVSIDPTRPWGAPDKFKAAFLINRELPDDERDLGGAALAFSTDGVTWTDYNDGFPVTHRAADTHNQLVWDPIASQYRLWTRSDMAGDVEHGEWRGSRVMKHQTGDLAGDPTAWTTLRDGIVVDDPSVGVTAFGVPDRQYHAITMSVLENAYLLTLDVWTIDGDDPQFLDFYVGASRDGVCFDETFVRSQTPLIEHGPPGAYDDEGAKPASQILSRDGMHLIYYTGVSSAAPGRFVALATTPQNRLIGARADDEGSFTTRPLTASGGALTLDVAAPDGEVVVEVLDRDSNPLPGYSGSSSARYEGVDESSLLVQWDERGLPSDRTQPIRLRIGLRNATLYAFRVE